MKTRIFPIFFTLLSGSVSATPLDLLNQSFAALGDKTAHCRELRNQHSSLSVERVEELKRLPASQINLFMSVAYEQAMNRCQQPELGDLLLLHAELRRAAVDSALLERVDEQEALLISPSALEQRIAYSTLPAPVRNQLEAMTEFQTPFDGMAVMEQLQSE